MKKLDTIELYKGATTVVELDLTEFAFDGGSVVFTMKNVHSNTVVMREEMSTPEVHKISFDDELTSSMSLQAMTYQYDIMWHIGGKRYPQCMPSDIVVKQTVGGKDVDN